MQSHRRMGMHPLVSTIQPSHKTPMKNPRTWRRLLGGVLVVSSSVVCILTYL
ncbi:hypothetical protein [Rubritalea tangerina]|uniref:hypothetical protein n=1 Tax=Rubritalea tangerina TaxID=430798 RepID=UPI00360F1379